MSSLCVYKMDFSTIIYSFTKYEVMEGDKKARNFRNYKVWQDAINYATEIYNVTNGMPWFEKKGLCDQLQRAVVSISSNIAEGCAKPSDVEFAKFLHTALGSSFEVETQLLIAKNVGYIAEDIYECLRKTNVDIQRQLSALLSSLQERPLVRRSK